MIRGFLFRPLAWVQFVRGKPRVQGIPLATSDEDVPYVTFRLNDAFSVLEQLQPSRVFRVKVHLYAFLASRMPKGKHMYVDNFRLLGIDTTALRTWSAEDLAAALVYAGTRAYLEVQGRGYHRIERQDAVAKRAAQDFRSLAARRRVWPVARAGAGD
ncbi:MAG TPA: hypothetical protein VEV39_01370 [Gemmatimonadales bacterium]|nr:hypothetical protein [Gemmatimonadales bacterium]